MEQRHVLLTTLLLSLLVALTAGAAPGKTQTVCAVSKGPQRNDALWTNTCPWMGKSSSAPVVRDSSIQTALSA